MDASTPSHAPSPPVPPPPARTMEEADARMWAAFAHLAGLVYLLGVPGILGSLVVWLWKRGGHPLVNEHGREAVNFQLSLLIYNLLAGVSAFLTCGFSVLVLIPLFAVFAVLVVVLPIIGTIQASEGRPYRYPLTIRLLD